MTVNQWLDKNLGNLHDDVDVQKTCVRILKNMQFTKLHALSLDAVLDRDMEWFEDTSAKATP